MQNLLTWLKVKHQSYIKYTTDNINIKKISEKKFQHFYQEEKKKGKIRIEKRRKKLHCRCFACLQFEIKDINTVVSF